jgi:hypothetical protein
VGRIVRVHWAGDDEKYFAVVQSYNAESHKHVVRYLVDSEHAEEDLESGATQWDLFKSWVPPAVKTADKIVPRKDAGAAGAVDGPSPVAATTTAASPTPAAMLVSSLLDSLQPSFPSLFRGGVGVSGDTTPAARPGSAAGFAEDLDNSTSPGDGPDAAVSAEVAAERDAIRRRLQVRCCCRRRRCCYCRRRRCCYCCCCCCCCGGGGGWRGVAAGYCYHC